MEKNKIKGISKAIYIIAKINSVLVAMAGVVIVIMMFAVPLLVSKTEISESKIKFFNNEYEYSIKEGELRLDDNVYSYSAEDKAAKIIDLFEKDNKLETTIIAEVTLAFGLATIALLYLAFSNLHKLFKNIYAEETPFNEKNINHIKLMAKYFLIAMIVSILGEFVVDIATGFSISLNINVTELLAVLIIYALSIIFEYGYKLQQEIDSTL